MDCVEIARKKAQDISISLLALEILFGAHKVICTTYQKR